MPRVLPLLLTLCLLTSPGCAGRDRGLPAQTRPIAWAQPLDEPGLPNLHRVSDALYRGGQPTAAGYRQLLAMGVRTVVSLRRSEVDAAALEEMGLRVRQIPLSPWRVSEADAADFLSILADADNHPVFVHCHHGADRTGAMVALYRVAVEGWSSEQAIAEMTRGGFRFHPAYRNLPALVRRADALRLRRLTAADRDD